VQCTEDDHCGSFGKWIHTCKHGHHTSAKFRRESGGSTLVNERVREHDPKTIACRVQMRRVVAEAGSRKKPVGSRCVEYAFNDP
jgi:hypothetical protein